MRPEGSSAVAQERRLDGAVEAWLPGDHLVVVASFIVIPWLLLRSILQFCLLWVSRKPPTAKNQMFAPLPTSPLPTSTKIQSCKTVYGCVVLSKTDPPPQKKRIKKNGCSLLLGSLLNQPPERNCNSPRDDRPVVWTTKKILLLSSPRLGVEVLGSHVPGSTKECSSQNLPQN